jgi:hypothetical protein
LSTATTINAIAQSVRVKQGNENYDALTIKAATVSTWVVPPTAPATTPVAAEGIITTTTSNHYWDFM